MTVTNYFPRKEDLVFDRAEAIIRSLADAAAARAPGESLLTAIRRDYAERIAAGDVTLGPPTATFARMVRSSHVLTSRGREITDLTEQALGDAIAAETGVDDPQQRIVAAHLASVHRVLFAEGARRILAGQPRDEICPVLAAAAAGPLTCSSRLWAAAGSGPARTGCAPAGERAFRSAEVDQAPRQMPVRDTDVRCCIKATNGGRITPRRSAAISRTPPELGTFSCCGD